jgi:hypothetical protein
MVATGCGPIADPARLTCADWLSRPTEQRLALADQLVGTSRGLVERIRVAQHRPQETSRLALISDVEGSLTKNCEVWPPRTRTIGEVFDALYR